jgi:hypothetical protein
MTEVRFQTVALLGHGCARYSSITDQKLII